MPDKITLTPRARAASHISTVLIAAGSPIGSSRMSTMRGSRSTMSGEISISCRSMPNCAGDLARVDGVVRHRLELLVLRPEGDRVGVDRARVLVGEDGDDAGVEAAGQEARHRDVGDQVRPDRFLDHRLQVRGRLASRRGGHVLNPPVLPDLGLGARADPGPGAGRELVHALDGAALLGNPVIQHGRDEGARLDPQLGPERRHDRLQLGGEHDAVAALECRRAA